jgi:hypothetical protein
MYKSEAQSIDICAEKGSIFVLKPHTLVAKGRHFRRRMPHLGEKEDVVIGERDVGGGHVADASHRAPIFVRQLLLDAARRERKRACHQKKKIAELLDIATGRQRKLRRLCADARRERVSHCVRL